MTQRKNLSVNLRELKYSTRHLQEENMRVQHVKTLSTK